MQRDALRQKLLTRRAGILAGGQALLLAAIGGRMYQLQIVDSQRYTVLADENRISLRLIAPLRGRILDRFGIALAENQQNYHLVIVPEQAGDVAATLDALGALVEVSEADRRRVLREIRRKHSFVPIIVRANLGWDEMARIEVAIPELPGLSIDQGVTRQYPFGETTAHVVGYVAAVSEQELDGDPLLELPDFRIGKNGVEKSQDLQLRGTAGTSQIEVNALGRVVRELARIAGKPGQDAVTSLDMAMQEFVTRRCSAEQSIACVLLDALTGDILALVSSPSFDPLPFSAGLTSAMWHELSNDPRKPLSNKVIAGVYPPGSTFKPVVASAALSAGILTPETSFTCPGYLQFGNATFHCWRHGGHGTLRLRDAIKKSCDVFFYETARRVGIDRLAVMARRFGFGDLVGIDIPGERPGLIPSREWKFATSGSAWTQGETLIAGIGQGSVLATPLQLATMVARLVTGRAVTPRLVRPEGLMPPGGTPAPGLPLARPPPADRSPGARRNERGRQRAGRHRLRRAYPRAGFCDGREVRHLASPPHQRLRAGAGCPQGPADPVEAARSRAVHCIRAGWRAAVCVRDGRRAWRKQRRGRLGRRGADLPRGLAGGTTARSRPAGSR